MRHFIALATLLSTLVIASISLSAEVETLPPEMLAVLRKAETGDAEAQYELGLMYGYGFDGSDELAAAVQLWRRVAKQLSPTKEEEAAFAKDMAESDTANIPEALKWIRLSADQGFAEAQNALGVIYLTGTIVPADHPGAIRWFRLAADQGFAASQFALGLVFQSGQGAPVDMEEAARWYKLAADQGHADAQTSLGFMYKDGEGVAENPEEALAWFSKAAKQGDSLAQYAIGVMYYLGNGVQEDKAEAAAWYRLAADQGLAQAQYNLGFMIANGEGVPENHIEAAKLFRLAAQQGDPNAQFNLGVMYANGQGVPEDYVWAYAWINLARAAGNKLADDALSKLKAVMTQEQIAESQRISRELFDGLGNQQAIATTPENEPPQSIRPSRVSQSARQPENASMASIESELQEAERRLAEAVAELAPAGNGPDLIETRINGTFEGWEGETIFKLENGQIWQQVTYAYTYHYAFRPKVWIIKTHGAYKMKVDGVSRSIFVKRLN